MRRGAPITPLNDRVLVAPDEQRREMASGLIIPENVVEKPRMGVVLAAGPGLVNPDGSRTPPSVSVGDTVLFTQYGGVDVELGKKHYLVMREADILGVVDRDALEAVT